MSIEIIYKISAFGNAYLIQYPESMTAEMMSLVSKFFNRKSTIRNFSSLSVCLPTESYTSTASCFFSLCTSNLDDSLTLQDIRRSDTETQQWACGHCSSLSCHEKTTSVFYAPDWIIYFTTTSNYTSAKAKFLTTGRNLWISLYSPKT